MFAYCLNNPVAYADRLGVMACTTFWGDNHVFSGINLMGGCGGGGDWSIPTSKAASQQVIENEIAFFNNTSEEVVLKAEYIAFYKGVLVIKVNLPEGSGFSCGIIFLDKDLVQNDASGVATLKHEYGHVRHLSQIGVPRYLCTVVLPSAIGAYFSNRDSLPVDYYSLPWERIADHLGDVQGRTYEPWANNIASAYWLFFCVFDRIK